MHKISMITFLLTWTLTSFSQSDDNPVMDSLSYGLGMSQAVALDNQGFDSINLESYIDGFTRTLMNEETAIDMQTASTMIKAYMQEQELRKQKVLLEAGQAFLQENAKREEVKVTESGLQYEVVVEGDGPVPTATDKVVTHYTGKLVDGTVFDSSVERGEPISFPVGGVIQGWQEALQMMPVGSKWMLYIPYDLAYGPRGAGGGVIPPYATLIFEIELIEIQ